MRNGRGGGRETVEVAGWTIQKLLIEATIEGQGPETECDAYCCRHGVHASLPERDRIMKYEDRIMEKMDDTQTRDSDRWFDDVVHEDGDFPGGLCIGTTTYKHKCVFLNGEGLCVLQLLEPELDLAEGEHLKPGYCFLFPITTWDGEVQFDTLNDGERPCCSLSRDGRGTPAVEAYEFELKMLLGDEGYESLKEKARELSSS